MQYSTANGTASAPNDYATTNGILIFNPGETTKAILVRVIGDTAIEANEFFVVNLSVPANASLAMPQAIGTIIEPDADGDGVTDDREIYAGTDPNNPASFLRFTAVQKESRPVLVIGGLPTRMETRTTCMRREV